VPQVNQAAEILNEVVSALMSGGEKAAEAYLTALDPGLLAIPVVAFIMDQGVHWLFQVISIAGQKFADKVVIDLQTNGERSDVITAGTALALAIGSNDPQAIKSAVDAASAAYKSAFNLDGWATPK
jgi:hypothetical protein